MDNLPTPNPRNRPNAFPIVLILGILAVLAPVFAGIVFPIIKHLRKPPVTIIGGGTHVYESAIDQWAIENGKVHSDTFNFSNVSDVFNVPAIQFSKEPGTQTPAASVSDVTRPDFWSNYAPEPAAAPGP